MSPLSRREFVAAGVAAGAGLVIGFYLPHRGGSKTDVFSPNAYLRITPDNRVTIVVARSETLTEMAELTWLFRRCSVRRRSG